MADFSAENWDAISQFMTSMQGHEGLRAIALALVGGVVFTYIGHNYPRPLRAEGTDGDVTLHFPIGGTEYFFKYNEAENCIELRNPLEAKHVVHRFINRTPVLEVYEILQRQFPHRGG